VLRDRVCELVIAAGNEAAIPASEAATQLIASNHRNGALATIGQHLLFVHAEDVILRTRRDSGPMFTCRSERRLVLTGLSCISESHPDPSSLMNVQTTSPNSTCADVTGYRSRGPIDPRVIQLDDSHGLVLVSDFVPARADEAKRTAANPDEGDVTAASPVGRNLHYEVTPIMHILEARGRNGKEAFAIVETHMLRFASESVGSMSSMEKNWTPFVVDGTLYAFQWLLNAKGRSVAFRIDLRTGLLTGRAESDARRLVDAIGAAHYAVISGGTPAVCINATHHLAIGHTMTATCNRPEHTRRGADWRRRCFNNHRQRSYALFAFVFRSSPPFSISGATREFRWEPPCSSTAVAARQSCPGHKSGDEGLGFASVAPASNESERLWGVARLHFPVGLVYAPMSRTSRERQLVVSWGYQDRVTLLTRVSLQHLLARMQHVRNEPL